MQRGAEILMLQSSEIGKIIKSSTKLKEILRNENRKFGRWQREFDFQSPFEVKSKVFLDNLILTSNSKRDFLERLALLFWQQLRFQNEKSFKENTQRTSSKQNNFCQFFSENTSCIWMQNFSQKILQNRNLGKITLPELDFDDEFWEG